MHESKVLTQTATCDDRGGDLSGVTFSNGGPGNLQECFKCESCGHSFVGAAADLQRIEVVVGNIGVIECESLQDGKIVFEDYVSKSSKGIGRAAGEDVALLVDGESFWDYLGDRAKDDSEELPRVSSGTLAENEMMQTSMAEYVIVLRHKVTHDVYVERGCARNIRQAKALAIAQTSSILCLDADDLAVTHVLEGETTLVERV